MREFLFGFGSMLLAVILVGDYFPTRVFLGILVIVISYDYFADWFYSLKGGDIN